MRIGIDLDEVIADTMPAIVRFHNEQYKTDLKKDDFRSYRFWETWGGTRDDAIRKMYEFFATDHFAQIDPIPGSLAAIKTLKERGHDLFIVTGRQHDIVAKTEKWIRRHFPKVFSGIRFANSYSRNSQSAKKSEICARLGITIMIEDDMDHAEELARSGITVLLFDQPWNQGDLEDHIERVFSWKQIVDRIH